jgi:hypothetical protein
VSGVVACVSENETMCRGRERGALYRQSDGWSLYRHRDTHPWYCTSAPLRVLNSTLESYTGKIYVLSFPLEY